MGSNVYKQVVAAMGSACEDMVRFTGERARPINAEYLFTVAVAKHIDKLNFYYGDPFRIYLEKKTIDFAKDCLLPIKFGHPMERGTTRLRRGSPKIDRNGRIDIAVYQDVPNNGYVGHQPICAIELKGFNPSRSRVLKDLKRNLEYFKVSGRTGNSILNSTIFAALHSWSRTRDAPTEQAKVERIKARYTSLLSELERVPGVEMRVDAHSVSIDLEGEMVDEVDEQVLDTGAIHHFAGVLVEFRAKKNLTKRIWTPPASGRSDGIFRWQPEERLRSYIRLLLGLRPSLYGIRTPRAYRCNGFASRNCYRPCSTRVRSRLP